jgi:hypothetical protein
MPNTHQWNCSYTAISTPYSLPDSNPISHQNFNLTNFFEIKPLWTRVGWFWVQGSIIVLGLAGHLAVRCGDPYSLLCPWWGEDNFPWCCVGCLCVYHEGCKISCFTWVDPYCALSYDLCVDMLTFWFWWMVFGWMFTNVIITNPTWVHLVSQVVLSCELSQNCGLGYVDDLYHD